MMTEEVKKQMEEDAEYSIYAKCQRPVSTLGVVLQGEREMEMREVKIEMEDGDSIYRKCQRPVTLKFKDVVYKIKAKANHSMGAAAAGVNKSGGNERAILKGISGAVVPGEMLAMMGPSGSGKTTLLTALGGRLGSNPLLSGAITYNGEAYSSAIKRNMGFVTQDDVLHPHLTVAETLLYTALLRLPPYLSRLQKGKHADAVITSLGLGSCRDSMVGNAVVRGVSGGERKRVSIGQEMLIDPGILFLDEPTSGLDSTTAQRIVSVLAELAKGGRAVVMTIHQPSSRLFYMFHKVLLLSDGSQVYFGKGSEVMPYFSGIGYSPAVPMNPADFLLDLVNGVTSEESQIDQQSIKEALVSAYVIHLQHKVKEEADEIADEYQESDKERKMAPQWNTTWWEQFKILLKRDLKERKHEAFSIFSIAQVMIVALVSGLLWWQSTAHLQAQVGLLFFMCTFLPFFSLYKSVFAFPSERATLAKERSSGMYRLSSYFIARTAGDLPMELILPTIFVTMVYLMAGLRLAAGNYFATLAAIFLCVLTSQGLGLALGASVMDPQAATTLASVILMTFMLAGGYYVDHVPPFIGWIKYFSILFYGFKMVLISQYSPDQSYTCGEKMLCSITDYPSIRNVGLDHKEIVVGILFFMFVVFRLIAYLALMRVGAT